MTEHISPISRLYNAAAEKIVGDALCSGFKNQQLTTAEIPVKDIEPSNPLDISRRNFIITCAATLLSSEFLGESNRWPIIQSVKRHKGHQTPRTGEVPFNVEKSLQATATTAEQKNQSITDSYPNKLPQNLVEFVDGASCILDIAFTDQNKYTYVATGWFAIPTYQEKPGLIIITAAHEITDSGKESLSKIKNIIITKPHDTTSDTEIFSLFPGEYKIGLTSDINYGWKNDYGVIYIPSSEKFPKEFLDAFAPNKLSYNPNFIPEEGKPLFSLGFPKEFLRGPFQVDSIAYDTVLDTKTNYAGVVSVYGTVDQGMSGASVMDYTDGRYDVIGCLVSNDNNSDYVSLLHGIDDVIANL